MKTIKGMQVSGFAIAVSAHDMVAYFRFLCANAIPKANSPRKKSGFVSMVVSFDNLNIIMIRKNGIIRCGYFFSSLFSMGKNKYSNVRGIRNHAGLIIS